MEAEPGGADAFPENKDPEIVGSVTNTTTYILSNYGWIILGCVLLLFYIKSLLEPKLKKMKEKKEEMDYLNVDPETARKRLEARELALNRLQEYHAAKVDKFSEEQQLKEEKKRQEKIEEWEKHQRGGGYHSKSRISGESSNQNDETKKDKRKNVYRTENYNPLMGGGGAGYRPPARRGGGG